MNVRSNLTAGMSQKACQQAYEYWNQMVKTNACPADPYAGTAVKPPQAIQPSQPAQPTQLPTYPAQSVGYVAGVYYPDRSGTCV